MEKETIENKNFVTSVRAYRDDVDFINSLKIHPRQPSCEIVKEIISKYRIKQGSNSEPTSEATNSA